MHNHHLITQMKGVILLSNLTTNELVLKRFSGDSLEFNLKLNWKCSTRFFVKLNKWTISMRMDSNSTGRRSYCSLFQFKIRSILYCEWIDLSVWEIYLNQRQLNEILWLLSSPRQPLTWLKFETDLQGPQVCNGIDVFANIHAHINIYNTMRLS